MENQRIRLSKTLLKNALVELLKEKSLEKISIYEICERANINRTTFYKYYYTQHDLLDDVANDFFGVLSATDEYYELNEKNLTQALNVFLEKKDVFLVLVNSMSDREFSDKFFSLPVVQQQFDVVLPKALPENIKTCFKTFLCQGCYAALRDWINDDDRMPPEQFARVLLYIIEKNIKTF